MSDRISILCGCLFLGANCALFPIILEHCSLWLLPVNLAGIGMGVMGLIWKAETMRMDGQIEELDKRMKGQNDDH